MEEAQFDLIVAGAGPSGSACAITAARAGAKVLLLEKDRFPRHKVCGEFVSSESLQLLAWLLGGEQFQERPEISHGRIFSAGTTAFLPISPTARSIPRFDLDYALLSAARMAGVEARESTTIRKVEDREPFRVHTNNEIFASRVVVNATGRWSQLTTHPINGQTQKWVGLKGHFREASPSQTVDLYFFDGGYCGVQPVGKDAVNACAMVRVEAAHSLEEVFSKDRELWRRSRDWSPLFPSVTTSALYFRRPQTECKGMLFAGDAAAFIDPFAGDGISLALQSGVLAAKSLEPFFRRAQSLAQAQQSYRRAYMKLFSPAFRNAARVRSVLSTPAPIRSILVRLASIRPFARALVRGTRTKGLTGIASSKRVANT